MILELLLVAATADCQMAQAAAIEAVREAWAPREEEPTWAETVADISGCGCQCIHDKVVMYRCMADEAEAEATEEETRRAREKKAVAALDAADEACGQKKPAAKKSRRAPQAVAP